MVNGGCIFACKQSIETNIRTHLNENKQNSPMKYPIRLHVTCLVAFDRCDAFLIFINTNFVLLFLPIVIQSFFYFYIMSTSMLSFLWLVRSSWYLTVVDLNNCIRSMSKKTIYQQLKFNLTYCLFFCYPFACFVYLALY